MRRTRLYECDGQDREGSAWPSSDLVSFYLPTVSAHREREDQSVGTLRKQHADKYKLFPNFIF